MVLFSKWVNCNISGSKSRGLMMRFDKLIKIHVGADSSRPSPIYRPPVDFPLSRLLN
jgi:hypothetical protein